MSVIGVFGGSFDPPHLGHQVIAYLALESGRVDQVLVIPTSSHALGKGLSELEPRLAMCKLAFGSLGDRVEVSDLEGRREGPSRTLDTLEALADERPGDTLRLMVGADILLETHLWHRWDEVTRIAPPLVFKRTGYSGGELPNPPSISSTEIRSALERREETTPLVSEAVLRYIHERALYT